MSKGIDQVNEAISGVDQVIQQNAASAEESASASEEMSAQAGQMKEYVKNLIDIVGSGEGFRIFELFEQLTQRGGWEEGESTRMEASAYEADARRLPEAEKERDTEEKPQRKRRSREVPPHKVIPMDDDFQDF